MIYKYEMACKEAGMSEEAIAEIRRMFDADKKKLKRLNKRLEDKDDELVILHVSEYEEDDDEDVDEYEIADPDTDVEQQTMLTMLLEQLDGYLDDLSEDDREFILTYFSFETKPTDQAMAKYGYSMKKVRYTRDRILKQLRKNFGEI